MSDTKLLCTFLIYFNFGKVFIIILMASFGSCKDDGMSLDLLSFIQKCQVFFTLEYKNNFVKVSSQIKVCLMTIKWLYSPGSMLAFVEAICISITHDNFGFIPKNGEIYRHILVFNW